MVGHDYEEEIWYHTGVEIELNKKLMYFVEKIIQEYLAEY